jgi:hypothetical protein
MGENGLLTVEELWETLGRGRVGRDAVYKLARRYGVRIGKRLLIPRRVLESLLEGHWPQENPAGEGRG